VSDASRSDVQPNINVLLTENLTKKRSARLRQRVEAVILRQLDAAPVISGDEQV